MKRSAYAPRHGLLGRGHRKHGELTQKDSWRLPVDDMLELRAWADQQGVTLADAVVMALTVGGAGLAEPDARLHVQGYLEELQRRLQRVRQDLARDKLDRQEANDRFRLQLQRDVALRTWQRRLLRRLSAQDRHEHLVLVEAAKRDLHLHVAADVEPANVEADVAVVASELVDRVETVPIGQRIPCSIREAVKAEALRRDLAATDIVAARVRRFLQLHGRDPTVRRLSVAIQQVRRDIAKTLKQRRDVKRATRLLRVRRHQIRDRLKFFIVRRGSGDRMFTLGERAAVEAQMRDPDALEAVHLQPMLAV